MNVHYEKLKRGFKVYDFPTVIWFRIKWIYNYNWVYNQIFLDGSGSAPLESAPINVNIGLDNKHVSLLIFKECDLFLLILDYYYYG